MISKLEFPINEIVAQNFALFINFMNCVLPCVLQMRDLYLIP